MSARIGPAGRGNFPPAGTAPFQRRGSLERALRTRNGSTLPLRYHTFLINRLVVENLRSRPVRTLLSALAIGVQVTMVLTLVGLSRGMVEDAQQRARGVGADIVIRPPGSSVFSFSGTFSNGVLSVVLQQPGIAVATGSFVIGIGG